MGPVRTDHGATVDPEAPGPGGSRHRPRPCGGHPSPVGGGRGASQNGKRTLRGPPPRRHRSVRGRRRGLWRGAPAVWPVPCRSGPRRDVGGPAPPGADLPCPEQDTARLAPRTAHRVEAVPHVDEEWTRKARFPYLPWIAPCQREAGQEDLRTGGCIQRDACELARVVGGLHPAREVFLLVRTADAYQRLGDQQYVGDLGWRHPELQRATPSPDRSSQRSRSTSALIHPPLRLTGPDLCLLLWFACTGQGREPDSAAQMPTGVLSRTRPPVRSGSAHVSSHSAGQERVTRRARERSRIFWLTCVGSPAGREQGAQRLRLRRTVWLSGSVGTPRPLDHRRGRTGVASRGPCSRLPEDQPG